MPRLDLDPAAQQQAAGARRRLAADVLAAARAAEGVVRPLADGALDEQQSLGVQARRNRRSDRWR
nr:hypothetical protein [Angustibacter aerolatus]